MRRAAIVAPVRTAVGSFGGSLRPLRAEDLAAKVVAETVQRSGVDPGRIEDVVFAQSYANSEAPCIGRWVALHANLPVEVPGLQIDRRCGGGLQAAITAAMTVQTGAADVVIAGGVESMSNIEHYTTTARWGAKSGNQLLYDRLDRGRERSQPAWRFGEISGMIQTAEHLASDYGIDREAADSFAVRSHQRALAAVQSGAFDDEIVTIEVPQRRGEPITFDLDEGIRPDTTAATLAKLRTVMPGGTVTAGNAAQQNDAAAACLVVAEDRLDELGLEPIGYLEGWAAVGCEPSRMGIGPVGAVQKLFDRTGLGFDDLSLIEINEAFSVQVLAVLSGWGLKLADVDDRLNVNGSGISLGHPIGATGVRILTTMLHELSRRGGGLALETMCIGGGQGLPRSSGGESVTPSLIAYATYLPRYRLAGADVGLRRGDRVVASYDEDSTTMAVAAAARAVEGHAQPTNVYFATSSPAYADKTNASAIHCALGLPDASFAADLGGTGRSGFAAWRTAAATGGLALSADVRVGRPGSADERLGGDGAAALLFGDGPAIAEIVAVTSLTAEFLDRWRSPRALTGEQWEERFGAERYAALVRTAVERILEDSGLADVDHVVVACPNGAVIKRVATLVKGLRSTSTSPIGFSGVADAGIALASVLDVAQPGETILVISAVDGCDGVLLRTTEHLPSARQVTPVSLQRTGGIVAPHLTYLSWHGLVELEPPRRPEPDRPAAPPAARAEGWKFGLSGTRCRQCGFVHLPPVRVCRSCGVLDDMDVAPVAALRGTVVTYTVDHLAYSPSPPMFQAVVDVDGGGRCTIEVTDVDQERLRVGARVAFSFRRLFTAGAVHDYFWKARLVDQEEESENDD